MFQSVVPCIGDQTVVTNVVTVLLIHKIVIGSKVVFVKLDGVVPPVQQISMNVVQLISVEL